MLIFQPFLIHTVNINRHENKNDWREGAIQSNHWKRKENDYNDKKK